MKRKEKRRLKKRLKVKRNKGTKKKNNVKYNSLSWGHNVTEMPQNKLAFEPWNTSKSKSS